MRQTRKRILCVDDDPDTCHLIAVLLSGYEVKSAGSLRDGLAMAKGGLFDLYLLDNWLPDGDGVELCRRIREFDPHTPVLFFSAAAYEADHQSALEAGAQGYLNKPLDLTELERCVARLIGEAEARSADAVRAEVAAVREELALRLAEIKDRHTLAREKFDRAAERAHAAEQKLKLKAHQAFIEAGGNRANFKRLWPGVLAEEALTPGYGDAPEH